MVYEQLDVELNACGKPGFLMQEQFILIEAPQVDVMKTQQTPNLQKYVLLEAQAFIYSRFVVILVYF